MKNYENSIMKYVSSRTNQYEKGLSPPPSPYPRVSTAVHKFIVSQKIPFFNQTQRQFRC